MQIHTNRKFVDDMTDADSFDERLPHIGPQLSVIREIRNIGDEVGLKSEFVSHKSNEGSCGKLVACIPWEIWVMLVQLDPDIDHDKKRFYAWLDKHPEYQAYTR
jgi:hypothetical protein